MPTDLKELATAVMAEHDEETTGSTALDNLINAAMAHECVTEWKLRAEKAEAERDEKWRVAENQRADLQTLAARRDDLTVALAAAQARERELREVLDRARYVGEIHFRTNALARGVADAIEAALSAPQDTTALREFGLKVARHVETHPGNTHEESVDDALKGTK